MDDDCLKACEVMNEFRKDLGGESVFIRVNWMSIYIRVMSVYFIYKTEWLIII